MQIAPGRAADLDAFVELLEEAGAWLWERGVHQWEPGSHRAQRARLLALLEDGALLLAHDAGGLCGGCLLTRRPGEAWPVGGDGAVYLYKLVVARGAAGSGLGARIVDAAEAWARSDGASLLRLDCWDGNHALRVYYRELGFLELGTAREHGYDVRLFEKPLAARP